MSEWRPQNTSKQWSEVVKSIQDMKTKFKKIEYLKKNLEIKNAGIQTINSEESLSSRLDHMEKRIMGL